MLLSNLKWKWSIFLVLGFLIFPPFFLVEAHDIPSKVPNEAKERKNPLLQSEAVLQKGGSLYQNFCLSCHGRSGKGDGPAASALPHPSPDLTKVLIPQTDGEIFWKISRGGGLMPSYEKSLTKEERWELIHYLRSLKPKEKEGGE